MSIDEKNLVVKANKLNEARFRLSVLEQRIILTMISKIKPNDENFKDYSFNVVEFAEITGMDVKSSYSQLKTATMTLLTTAFTINEDDGPLQIGWLNYAKYYDNEGRFELSFSHKLKPYLLALQKEFTRYQLHNVVKLKSGYSVRIYELLKQYQGIGSRIFDLDDFKALVGVPDGSLNGFANFKRLVLERAHNEMVKTDILFDYEPLKTGRRISAIKFTIRPNEDVIKRSGKIQRKGEKVHIVDLGQQRQHQELQRSLLNSLNVDHPDDFQTLEAFALLQLEKDGNLNSKKKGFKNTLRLKMCCMVEEFIKNKAV